MALHLYLLHSREASLYVIVCIALLWSFLSWNVFFSVCHQLISHSFSEAYSKHQILYPLPVPITLSKKFQLSPSYCPIMDNLIFANLISPETSHFSPIDPRSLICHKWLIILHVPSVTQWCFETQKVKM